MAADGGDSGVHDLGIHPTAGLPRRLFACDSTPLNTRAAVCIGLFRGDDRTHSVYGAIDRKIAITHARKMRANGIGAKLVWLNTGAWCKDLWVQDLQRPFGTHPDRFYGSLSLDPKD